MCIRDSFRSAERDNLDLLWKSSLLPCPKFDSLSILITSAPISANTIPQNGPGPIPENSIIVIPVNGPDITYLNTLEDFNRYGSNTKVANNDVISAMAVNRPNKTVGVKFEKVKIKNPMEIVKAVYKIAFPIELCDIRIAFTGDALFCSCSLYL